MWRLREARGIASRFDGLLGSHHGRDAAIRFPRKPAHSGCCWTLRSQNPPCLRGKLRRPTHPKTADLHSFGDYCRGDEPQAGNGTRTPFENNRACIAPQPGPTLAELLDSARSLDPAKKADPARLLDSAPTTKLNTSPASQHRPWRVLQTRPRVSGRPIPAVRWDKSPLANDQSHSTPPMPLVSRTRQQCPPPTR